MTEERINRKSHVQRIEDINLEVSIKVPWGAVHWRSWNRAVDQYDKGFQARTDPCPLGPLILEWAKYADTHFRRFDSRIGEDNVLGPAWMEIGKNLKTLMNGELNGLDGGTLDRIVYEILEAEGFHPY